MSHRTASIRRRLWLGLSRNFVTSVFVQGSTFGLNLLAARVLPAAAFGQLLMMLTTLTAGGGIGQLASGYTATKYLAEFKVRDRERAGRVIALCFLLAVGGALTTALLLAAGAHWIAASWLQAPELAIPLVAVAPVVGLVVLNGHRTGALNGLEAYEDLARIGVVSGVTYLAFGLAGVVSGGIVGALAGIGASALVQWLLLERATARALHSHAIVPSYRDASHERATVAHFALPASLSGLVSMAAVWLAAGLLVRHTDGTQMALFGAANSMRVIVLFLPLVVSGVAATLLNTQLGDGRGYRRVFWGTLLLAVGSATVAAAAIALLGDYALRLFGPGFEAGVGALRLLMVAAVAEASANNVYQVVQSHAQMWKSLCFIVLPRDTLLVVLAARLTPEHGAVGLAAAYASAWVLGLLIVSGWTWGLGLQAGGPRRAAAAVAEEA